MAIGASPLAPDAARRASRSRRHRLGVIVVSLFIAGITACSKPGTPEARVRGVIAAAVQAAEAGDAAGVRAVLSSRYADDAGRDRQAVERLIRVYLFQNRPLYLYARVPVVNVAGDRADAVVYAALASRRVEAVSDSAPLDANLYRVELALEWETASGACAKRGGDRRRSASWSNEPQLSRHPVTFV